jgi:hypothetical protein
MLTKNEMNNFSDLFFCFVLGMKNRRMKKKLKANKNRNFILKKEIKYVLLNM